MIKTVSVTSIPTNLKKLVSLEDLRGVGLDSIANYTILATDQEIVDFKRSYQIAFNELPTQRKLLVKSIFDTNHTLASVCGYIMHITGKDLVMAIEEMATCEQGDDDDSDLTLEDYGNDISFGTEMTQLNEVKEPTNINETSFNMPSREEPLDLTQREEPIDNEGSINEVINSLPYFKPNDGLDEQPLVQNNMEFSGMMGQTPFAPQPMQQPIQQPMQRPIQQVQECTPQNNMEFIEMREEDNKINKEKEIKTSCNMSKINTVLSNPTVLNIIAVKTLDDSELSTIFGTYDRVAILSGEISITFDGLCDKIGYFKILDALKEVIS